MAFHQEHLIISDDAFGIKSYDLNANELWSREVPGGVSMFKTTNTFIAIVDNLGRLVISDLQGNLINSNLPYSSICKLENYVICSNH